MSFKFFFFQQLQHLNCQWSKSETHIVFDFHQECKGGSAEALNKKLKPQINQHIDDFGFFFCRNGKIEKVFSTFFICRILFFVSLQLFLKKLVGSHD